MVFSPILRSLSRRHCRLPISGEVYAKFRYLSTSERDSVAQIAGPIQAYTEKVARHEIQHDRHQLKAVKKLQDLYGSILDYDGPSESAQKKTSSSGWFSSLFSSEGQGASSGTIGGAPKGLYLYGGTGTGKTFMMDLFYHEAPVARKRRVHFHRFMLDVHARLHQLRKQQKDGGGSKSDPLVQVAAEMVREAWLLCFDEFQVTDVADAAILKRLFEEMLAQGAVVVATSNRAPPELYENGLQRELFVPFIRFLEERHVVYRMSPKAPDYRHLKAALSADAVFQYPPTAAARAAFEAAWAAAVQGAPVAVAFAVAGRRLVSPRSCVSARAARFRFEELCGRPLGAADYLALADAFHTVFLEDVPRLDLTTLPQARRFITLVDALYEARVRVVALLADAPARLLDLGEEEGGGGAGGAAAAAAAAARRGHDEVFAFDRTVSRLMEMQSTAYLNATWRLGGPDFLAQFDLGALAEGDLGELFAAYDMNRSGALDAAEVRAFLGDLHALSARGGGGGGGGGEGAPPPPPLRPEVLEVRAADLLRGRAGGAEEAGAPCMRVGDLRQAVAEGAVPGLALAPPPPPP